MWIVNRYAFTKAMLKCRSNPIKLPIIQYTKCNGYKAFGCRLIDTQSDFEPFKNLQRSITPEENTHCVLVCTIVHTIKFSVISFLKRTKMWRQIMQMVLGALFFSNPLSLHLSDKKAHVIWQTDYCFFTPMIITEKTKHGYSFFVLD